MFFVVVLAGSSVSDCRFDTSLTVCALRWRWKRVVSAVVLVAAIPFKKKVNVASRVS